ncbi:MAG TPA: hypothetical protein VNI01_01120, partial [Elusimicrobiota bacterium]|nr:hypothetical protein [Elusimicrobiota bacterium]
LALEGSEHYLLQDPAAPLSWISMAPLPPDAVSVPAGLSEEEKNLLAHNLLRLAWSPAEWRALGWALPYLNGAFFDRLTPETRALCAAELGGLREDVQRAAAGFLAGAGRAVGEDAKLDRIVSRWLLVFKADASRALHLASSLKDEEHILDEEDAAEQPPLVQFLTGRISLEPLRAEEAQDTSSRVLGRSLEEIPLSALAGARANWGPATAKGAALSVADLHGLPRSGYPQTEQAIERAHGAEAGYEWTREGVQNGVKASEQAGVAPRVELTTRVAQRGGRSELRASVRDHGAGMDVREQLFHLLALERSSFAEGDDPSNGFNGRGWYKFLVRADRVRVVTGKKGSGRHTELELYRKPRPEGGFRWQVARFVELEGAFEGTRMDWIQERPGSIAENTLAMELESALIADSVETYAGALGEFGVGILMNGRRVSEQVSALGAVEWAPGEEVRVVRTSSKKRRVLQKGYFIMDLEQDPELLALLPGELRRFLRERGLSLSLPVSRKPHALSISPDRDRSALAGKERYMERLQKAVLAATARAAAREMAEGLWRPRGLPQDYLYRSGHLWASTGTLRHSAHELAKALEGRWDSVNPAAVRERLPDGGDGAALAHFLAYVKFPWNGRELSLATLREDVILLAQAEKEGGGKLAGVRAMLEERRRALMDLPDGYRAMYREAWRRYRDLAGATAKEERWKEDEEPPSPEESRRRSLLAGLISGVMTPLLRERMKQPKAFYRVLFGKTPYPRVAVFGKDWLGLNLNAGQVQSWLDWADRATSGESTPEEDYKQLFELVETAVHEDAHAWEPTGMETHNAEFLERMRATFLDMARKRTVPEDFLRRATAERAAGLR